MALRRQKPSKAGSADDLTEQALQDLRRKRGPEALTLAKRAVQQWPKHAPAWHAMGLAKDLQKDYSGAIEAFQTAIDLSPQTPQPYADLARLMIELENFAIAEGLLKIHLTLVPDSVESVNDLAWAQACQLDTAKAIVTLIDALERHPRLPMLWNTLGLVLMYEGRMDEALPIFREALVIDPEFGQTRLALADALMSTSRGDQAVQAQALAEGQTAIDAAPTHKQATAKVAQAKRLFSLGRLEEAWTLYEARHDLSYEDATVFDLAWPKWQPGQAVEGKHILLIGEQGLGDEILFAHAIPDLIAALGPTGRLTLAMDPRLLAIAARSFPSASVIAHTTARKDGLGLRGLEAIPDAAPNVWSPMASLLGPYRPSVASYGNAPSFLVADPARIAHWQAWLRTLPEGPKVGLVWKSLIMDLQRQRHFPKLVEWAPILAVPGVQFIALQYGEIDADLDQFAALSGKRPIIPPGIDLKDDLDDLAALACALDLTLGPPNATTNLAAACGANVGFLVSPDTWPMFGTDHYPAYPKAKVFAPLTYTDRGPMMQAVADYVLNQRIAD